jgi:tetrahydromethanopterin S-methyltransferase subunit A
MNDDALRVIAEQLSEATAAKKCHPCGCFHSTVEAIERSPVAAALEESLSAARVTFTEAKYDCLGCQVCWPAIAANAYAEAFPEDASPLEVCATSDVRPREGWPPLPGDYTVVRYQAPVAVCTLNSEELRQSLATSRPEGLAVVGTLHTENLGIERLIRNVIANPNIRALLVCGDDTRQAVGHLPGQSLRSLYASGLDENGRIRGASGKRPVLKNVTQDEIALFLEQVELVDAIGELDTSRIEARVMELSSRTWPPPRRSVQSPRREAIVAQEPKRLVTDPCGYVVVYPDRTRRCLVVEHYANSGVLTAIIEGFSATSVYSELIARQLVSRLDHAAYVGRELARAERSIETGEPYVQDRAPGEAEAEGCGCKTSCS